MVLITGAARGQGAAEARLFADHGARLFVTDVLEEEGRDLAAGIPGATYLNLDVGEEQSWRAVSTVVEAEAGGLDVLINNAGITHFASLMETRLADFERLVRINLFGVLLGMQAAVPLMRSRGGGSIINIGSIAGLAGRANLSAYASTKWAMRGLSQSAAIELGPLGIRVNSIMPGLIITPMTEASYSIDAMQARGASLPLGRAGQPRDVATVALFLASDASAFCTGTEIVCDGGQLAGS
ncbi:glucose 1-dehydrogenase [Sphingomonas sp. YL-JM2C]